MSEELCDLDATELARRIRLREVSAREVMSAHLARIARVDPSVNALPIRITEEAALAQADEADRALARGAPCGVLHGLPLGVKDLVNARGLRTTRGSPLFRDFVAPDDTLHVARLREAGALIVGKTNVPEFGAGSHTWNPLFGVTRNPYDLSRTVGGSSGGAAAALAAGLLPLCDGSDLGGSLRNPAGFCNLVGFRPSIGRVPQVVEGPGWLARMGVLGPLGRSVADAALLFSAMAGPDPRDPLSLPEPGARFGAPLERSFRGTRIAWGGDLGFAFEPEILEVTRAALARFETLGCVVGEAAPDLRGALESFQVLRAVAFLALSRGLEAAAPDWRRHVKETVLWNCEQGEKLTVSDVVTADTERARLFQRMALFFETYDFLAVPTAQVRPFPVEVDWVREIAGQKMKTYIDWMSICCVISATGLPAISVPCGFTADGLPVGLQIVGRAWADFEVLQLAHAFEQAAGAKRRLPRLEAG